MLQTSKILTSKRRSLPELLESVCESNKEVELVNWQVNLGVLGCQTPAKAGFWQYRKTFIITINLRCRIAHNNLSIKLWQKKQRNQINFLLCLETGCELLKISDNKFGTFNVWSLFGGSPMKNLGVLPNRYRTELGELDRTWIVCSLNTGWFYTG